MKKLVNTLKAIHESRLSYKAELTEEQKRRLEICYTCKFNSQNVSQLSLRDKIYLKLNKFLNRFYGLKVLIDAMCTVCGCQIVFLTTQEEVENKCKKGKW